MSRIDSRDLFIKVWQSSSSAKEVATKMGIRSLAASNRAMRYRKQGISLKEMPKFQPKEGVDWSELAAFAASFIRGNALP